ncbi:hypothetical protein ACFX15_027251 [Malus domestica]
MGELKEGESCCPETQGSVPGLRHGGDPKNDVVVQLLLQRRGRGIMAPISVAWMWVVVAVRSQFILDFDDGDDENFDDGDDEIKEDRNLAMDKGGKVQWRKERNLAMEEFG